MEITKEQHKAQGNAWITTNHLNMNKKQLTSPQADNHIYIYNIKSLDWLVPILVKLIDTFINFTKTMINVNLEKLGNQKFAVIYNRWNSDVRVIRISYQINNNFSI